MKECISSRSWTLTLSYEIVSEIEEHKENIAKLLLRRLRKGKVSLDEVLDNLLTFWIDSLKRMEIVDLSDVSVDHLCEGALERMASRDPKDLHVLMLALYSTPSIILSNDKDFEEVKQELETCNVKVLKVGEFLGTYCGAFREN
ncbi:hypothetical protein IPA_02420 [Ignicoccus pacificus DSM 13166]|uniref:PIN domain-containing protein n=1 Tax=Ignicoccus pacificus DSM 13166 TaxID=940294 RepID=A0A977PKP2_9CREN|nr:hypothetical protein IPA_02420 [Ignicoccus pacificus DSM 13166]